MHPDDIMILKGLKLKISNYILKEIDERTIMLKAEKYIFEPLEPKKCVT